MEEVQLLSAMWFALFPTADTAVSYFVSECFNISQPSPMYISTTGEGQGETREATNKTDLGLKRQSQFSMYNLTARKVDANNVPRADTNPSLCKVSWPSSSKHSQPATAQKRNRGISRTIKAPCLTPAGEQERPTCSQPQPEGHERTIYTCVGYCILLAACLNFPVANHRRGNEFQGNKHQWVISTRQLKILRAALDLHRKGLLLSRSLIWPTLS